MSKTGVSAVSGISSPVVGETNTYNIVSWYPGTSAESRDAKKVTWELFKKRSDGKFTSTKIKKTGNSDFTFGESAAGETYRLEAYLFDPEGGGLTITPKAGKIPKINKVELFYIDDTKGSTFSFTEKLRARANCVNMLGKDVVFTLWEDDANGSGHNAANTSIDSKKAKVDEKGLAAVDFTLTSALMKKAAAGEKDAKLEFYVTVEYFKNKKHATGNVNINNPFPQPPAAPKAPANSNPAPANPAEKPKAPESPAAQKPPSKKEEKGIMDRISEAGSELWDWAESAGTAIMDKIPAMLKPDGKSPAIVKAEPGVEGISDAYFAKKEYTKLTGEAAGTLDYSFGGNGNKTKSDADKEKIAKIILGKASVIALSKKKEYTTLQAIKDGLTKEVYNKTDKVTFKTFKLGAEFKRINSAPFEAKVYLVAKTYVLDGKTATITIKEKDGLMKGAAGAVLPILEITEADMEDTKTSTEVKGTEKTEFTATIKDGMVKVPVQLRPKSNDELKTWKEKLAKGKKDADYTYKFGAATSIVDEKTKKSVAAIILKNAKAGNSSNKKFADGITANAADIEKALGIKNYAAGATIAFPTYKKLAELLYLNVKATGTKEHNKEFLKAEGAYFKIGNSCYCNRDITVAEFEEILKKVRESEKNTNTTGLFYASNCDVNDKTVSGFVAQLNKTFADYEINTCIRKIHFLAQTYHESDRLQTTYEYASGNGYDPGQHAQARANGNTVVGDGPRYKGKGLMQLTWKNNYKLYKGFSGEDVITSPNRVGSELKLALDSAGWFWKQGKVLGDGTTWTVPSTTYSLYDKSNGKDFPKTQVSYKADGVDVKYASISLNLLADKDYIDTISWLVNGGGNGRLERRKYLKTLKETFVYPKNCENAEASDKGSSSVTIHFVGDTAREDGISQLTRTVLEEVGETSENTDIYITSTARTPEEQARIMYENIARTGAATQKGIYANAGDQVIDVYTEGQAANKTEAAIKKDMEDKINEVGPSNVSKHLADPTVMNTFDVSISRLKNPADFKAEMQKRSELHKLLDENGAYHVEINQ